METLPPVFVLKLKTRNWLTGPAPTEERGEPVPKSPGSAHRGSSSLRYSGRKRPQRPSHQPPPRPTTGPRVGRSRARQEPPPFPNPAGPKPGRAPHQPPRSAGPKGWGRGARHSFPQGLQQPQSAASPGPGPRSAAEPSRGGGARGGGGVSVPSLGCADGAWRQLLPSSRGRVRGRAAGR